MADASLDLKRERSRSPGATNVRNKGLLKTKSTLTKSPFEASPEILFPSFESIFDLVGLEDKSTLSGKADLSGLDIGLYGGGGIPIGYGAHFSVAKVEKCCGGPVYVQKSVLAGYLRLGSDPMEAVRFQNAVMLELRALSHPPLKEHENIVDLLSIAWETDPIDFNRRWPVLIMEYANGGTLSDLFSHGTLFALQTKAKLCLDVARGLGALHECGIVHGDLKPDNVLIFQSPSTGPEAQGGCQYTAKLADFGSSLADIDDKFRLSAHTKLWNAPECGDFLDHDGLKKTDVYSYGLLVWSVILDGKSPFLEVEVVRDALSGDLTLAAVEGLKRRDGGAKLLELAKESIANVFITPEHRHLIEIFDKTLQLKPDKRDIFQAQEVVESVVLVSGLTIPRKIPNKPNFGMSCGHAMQLSRGRMRIIWGPLRNHLDTLAEQSGDPQERTAGSVGATIMLAEADLEDFFEGRHDNRQKVFESFQKLARLGIMYARNIIVRLMRALELSVPDDLSELYGSLLAPAGCGLLAATEELASISQRHSQRANFCARVFNGAIYTNTLDPDLWSSLSPTAEISVTTRFQKAFPMCSDNVLKSVLIAETGDHAIHLASRCGMLENVEPLVLQFGIDIDSRNSEQDTPLLLACRSGHSEVAMFLIQNNANVTAVNSFNETPLHWLHSFSVAEMNDIATALLRRSTSMLNTVSLRRDNPFSLEDTLIAGTPSDRAIMRANMDAVLTLLEFFPSISEETHKRAIDLACQLHYPAILSVLLEKGNGLLSSEGVSFLGSALENGSISRSCLGQIQRHGSKYRKDSVTTLEVLYEAGIADHFADIPGYPGCNALHYAVWAGTCEAVEFLLKNGCSKYINTPSMNPGIASRIRREGVDNVKDPSMWLELPLYVAFICKRRSMFELLLKHGADADSHVISNQGNLTLLHHCAVEETNVAFAKLLLEYSKTGDVNESPDNYETPLASAVRTRQFEMARLLLDRGADVNHESTEGTYRSGDVSLTLLGVLIGLERSLSSVACINFLLGTGKANFVVSQKTKTTALHMLANTPEKFCDELTIRYTFKSLHRHFKFTKEQLDLRDQSTGYTALESAILHQNHALVEELLLAGATWDEWNDKFNGSAIDVGLHLLRYFPNDQKFDIGPKSAYEQEAIAHKKTRLVALHLCKAAHKRCVSASEKRSKTLSS